MSELERIAELRARLESTRQELAEALNSSHEEQLRSLTEQLAAAQAVIAECGRLAGQIMFDRDAEPARTAILDVTRHVGTDALQAHDRHVTAKALTNAAELADTFSEGSGIAAALRVTASLVPGNPEPTEGEVSKWLNH